MVIELLGLPNDCKVMWHSLEIDSEDHIHDEDITYIILKNGVQIDAGQYGMPDQSCFEVNVVSQTKDPQGWKVVENSICRTTQEVANEIVRLANKYNDEWYANVASYRWEII